MTSYSTRSEESPTSSPILFSDESGSVLVIHEADLSKHTDIAASSEAFRNVLLEELPKHYNEVDRSFTDSLLATSAEDSDPNGYFTQSKKIFWLVKDGFPVGFTVASIKRGGSVKIGPTAVVPTCRRQGYATLLRDSVESFLELNLGCRKLYMTIAVTNVPALMFNLERGFKVEGILKEQYRTGYDEIILARFSGDEVNPSRSCLPMPASTDEHLEAARVIDPTPSEVRGLLQERMSGIYDGIDQSYFGAIASSCSESRQSYEFKGKQLFAARRGAMSSGVAVYVPKRGGSVKLSPFMADDQESSQALIKLVSDFAAGSGRRKIYAHVPLASLDNVRWLLEQDYLIEGLLREPYSEGVDFAVMGRSLQ